MIDREALVNKLTEESRTLIDRTTYDAGATEDEGCEIAVEVLESVAEGYKMRLQELQKEAEDR